MSFVTLSITISLIIVLFLIRLTALFVFRCTKKIFLNTVYQFRFMNVRLDLSGGENMTLSVTEV